VLPLVLPLQLALALALPLPLPLMLPRARAQLAVCSVLCALFDARRARRALRLKSPLAQVSSAGTIPALPKALDRGCAYS